MAIIVGDIHGNVENNYQMLAVLIDADNAQASIMGEVFNKISSFGNIAIKRIYGDFSSPLIAPWKTLIMSNAVKPIQQFAYATGKNATDFAMVIDAMDLLYTRKYDGFCLVTSDSDFTSLAIRLREEGMLVMGFGKKETPESYRIACHQFFFTESFKTELAVKKQNITFPALAMKALEDSADITGWAYIGTFGNRLAKIRPDFDFRKFGYKKLSDFVRANKELFILDERSNNGTDQKTLYLRARL